MNRYEATFRSETENTWTETYEAFDILEAVNHASRTAFMMDEELIKLKLVEEQGETK